MMHAEELKHTVTSAPVSPATSIRRGSSSARLLARASSRNAAAASAEPPPMPAATGSTFSSVNSPTCRSGTRSPKKRAAFKIMVAIDTAADHAQGQVDLGARVFNEHCCSGHSLPYFQKSSYAM